MASTYQDRYTWSHWVSTELGDALMHSNGVISVAFEWKGQNTALESPSKIEQIFSEFKNTLESMDDELSVVLEHHFFRDYADETVAEYLQYGEQNIVRDHEFAFAVRNAMAQTVSQYALRTRLYVVVNLVTGLSNFAIMRAKKELKKSQMKIERLLSYTTSILPEYNGGQLLDKAGFERLLWLAYRRDLGREDREPQPNPRFKISDRVAQKPTFEDGLLKLGDTWTKCLLLIDYPDADESWFYNIARFTGLEMQVTQIVKPLSSASVIRSSASKTKRSMESANEAGGENVAGMVQAHNSFRRFVADNNLKVFGNAYYICLHSTDKQDLIDKAREFVKLLGNNTIIAETSEAISYAAWRFSKPAQGYLTSFSRPDHSIQVANMAPFIAFDRGDYENQQMLRVTSDGQAVTLGYPKTHGAHHGITIAKTNSGKGVEMGATICELYPLGINFYITEIGNSYQWPVEAFGGDYRNLNSQTVISPFPEFSLIDPNLDDPLDGFLEAVTIEALLPLIGKSAESIAQHVDSVARQCLQELYRHSAEFEAQISPTLKDYYEVVEHGMSHFEGVKNSACQVIKDNLDSFLSGGGRNFEKPDTIDFTKGIMGFNFKELMNDRDLAKFILVFISLRLKQIAFADSTPTRIILDEFHEFTEIDYDLMRVLTKQLTRMGRKEAGYLDIVSQETSDADLDAGVLNSMSHRRFMFLQDGHEQTRSRFKMNDNVLSRWQGYRDPDVIGKAMDYRQCMRMQGQHAWDLFLKFPDLLLDLTSTNSRDLELKNMIGQQTKDPFERIQRLREMRNG